MFLTAKEHIDKNRWKVGGGGQGGSTSTTSNSGGVGRIQDGRVAKKAKNRPLSSHQVARIAGAAGSAAGTAAALELRLVLFIQNLISRNFREMYV